MSSWAPRVNTSSGKPKLALDFAPRNHTTCCHIFVARRQIGHKLGIAENLQRLNQRFVLGLRHHNRRGPAVSRDYDMLMDALDLVEEFGQVGARLSERQDFSHGQIVHYFDQ